MKKALKKMWGANLLVKTSIALLLLIGFNSCKKAGLQVENQSNNEVIAKALSWLNKEQASVSTQKDKDRFEQLKINLELTQTWVEDIREQEKIILVPIKDGFEINCNKNKPVTNYLFLIIDSKNQIREGQIFQYQAPNSTEKTKLPVNILHEYYTLEPVSGQFTHLEILNPNYFIHETEFRKGRLYRTATIEQKDKALDKTIPTNCVIIDWYLTTTIMYEDGTTEVFEEYLYSSNVCGGGSGGSGGNNTPAAMPKEADVTFKVGEGINYSVFWNVKSLEHLEGKKTGTERAVFTSIKHTSTSLNQNSDGGVTAMWSQGDRQLSMESSTFVTASNSGEIWFVNIPPVRPLSISKGTGWASFALWP